MRTKLLPKVYLKGWVSVLFLYMFSIGPLLALIIWIVIPLCLSDEEGKRLYSKQKISTDALVKVKKNLPLNQNP